MKNKGFYEIITSMTFSKTILVPVDEVESLEEAIKMVDDAVENCQINLLGEDAECETEWRSIMTLSEEDEQRCRDFIINKNSRNKTFKG